MLRSVGLMMLLLPACALEGALPGEWTIAEFSYLEQSLFQGEPQSERSGTMSDAGSIEFVDDEGSRTGTVTFTKTFEADVAVALEYPEVDELTSWAVFDGGQTFTSSSWNDLFNADWGVVDWSPSRVELQRGESYVFTETQRQDTEIHLVLTR